MNGDVGLTAQRVALQLPTRRAAKTVKIPSISRALGRSTATTHAPYRTSVQQELPSSREIDGRS